MSPAQRPVAAGLIATLVFALAAGVVVQAQEGERVPDRSTEAAEPTSIPQSDLLRDLDIQVWGPWRQTAERDYLFEGKVTIAVRDERIQADRMSLVEGRYVEAEGNVVVVWQGNRISGDRMTYDLETGRGAIERAMGQVQGDFIFWAKVVEKIGDRTVRLKSATVTTCTQPVPYWSFSVSSATVTIDKYARMWNVVVRATKVPFFYSPYLLWPVKQDRALGLLLPEFHTNDKLGQSISQPLFIPIGRSADLTLVGEYFSEAGFGFGGEFRVIPNRRGSARLEGFAIDDQVSTETVRLPDDTFETRPIGTRYNFNYRQTQEFLNGFRMTADINSVSDFDYYTDYERELDRISTPAILQRVEFSRNGDWTSMNAREYRREQLFADNSSLLQQTLPEIEWRGRSRKLGKTPLYLQYEASVASITQREMDVVDKPAFRADYLRGDLFPTVSLPWSPTPWIDVTPTLFYRFSYYTQQQTVEDNPLPGGPQSVRVSVDEALKRELWGTNLLVIGPKVSRIFGRGKVRQYKHSFEPRLSYGFDESFDRAQDIILFDEVDVFNGAGNAMSYSLTQRLFTKRPRSEEATIPSSDETIMMPDGSVSQGGRPLAPKDDPEQAARATPPPTETVEIATLEVGQRRSFDQDLSFADFDGDGTIDETSRFSDLVITGRYNPDSNTSIDLRSSYNILWDRFNGATLSGGIRRRLAQIRFSLVYRNGLGFSGGEPVPDDTQLRLTTGFTMLRGKLRLLVDGTVNVDPRENEDTLPSRAWRLQYSTQCCTFYLEGLNRTYVTSERQEFRFRVDLRGIGKILSVSY
jgi:hypothetical protein